MGRLVALLALAFGILVAAISNVVADEFKEWTPWIVRKLVALSVLQLPAMMRERYSEEWSSYVDDVPGYAGKLLVAIGLFFASLRMRGRARRTLARLAKLRSYWIHSKLHQPGSTSIPRRLEELRAVTDGLTGALIMVLEADDGNWAKIDEISRMCIGGCDAYDAILESDSRSAGSKGS